MTEFFRHIFGLCGESHPSLLNLTLINIIVINLYLFYYFKVLPFFQWLKEKIKKG